MKETMEELNNELKQALGDQYVVRAYYKENLGPHGIVVIHDTKPANGIWQNSPVAIHLICHLCNGRGEPLPQGTKLSWESLGHTRIKFRKMSSDKGIKTLNGKLVSFIQKIKPELDQILTKGE